MEYITFFTMHLSVRRLLVCLFLLAGTVSCKKSSVDTIPPVVPPAPPLTLVLNHALPSVLHESSGLCYTDGNLWTFGDSGNPNAIYKIDTATGAILQIVTIQNFPNNDWEDITADDSYVYVGDFGNNDGIRKDLKVLRVKKIDISSNESQLNVNADAINFSFADQLTFTANGNTNFDCEAMASIDSSLYLFTKDGGDLQTRSYRLPKDTGTYSLTPIDTFNTSGKVTSAAYNPVTKELALGGYLNNKIFPFIWFFKNYSGDHFFNGAKIREALNSNNTPFQTEGLDYVAPNKMFLSCESTPQIPASLYGITLNLNY